MYQELQFLEVSCSLLVGYVAMTLGNQLPTDTASYPRIVEPLTTLLSKPQKFAYSEVAWYLFRTCGTVSLILSNKS